MLQSGEKSFEIALVGDFQCGKSTFFDALCSGRDIAPRGGGVKTSACAVSVCVSNGAHEYAEIEWYSPDELRAKLQIFKASLEDGSDVIEFERLERVIKTFGETQDLMELRNLKRMSISDAAKVLSYPVDWEKRWANNKMCGGYSSAKELAFLFIKRVIFHLNVSLPSNYVFTDTPGFNAGGWDFSTAQDTMRRADVVCCVMNGREKAIAASYFQALSWVKKEGIAAKLFFIVNASSLAKGKSFLATNKAEIKNRGFVLNQEDIPVFSALLSFMAKAKGLSKNELGTTISKWLDLDIWDDIDKIKDYCSDLQKIEQVANVSEALAALIAFADKIKKGPPIQPVSSEGLINSPHGLEPDAGYEWVNPGNPNDLRVKWKPGKPMPNNPHVLAGSKPKIWLPEEGYTWVSTETEDYRVVWSPERSHSTNRNILAGQKEGTWYPKIGYDWIDPSNMATKFAKGVRWCSGREHPNLRGVVAAQEEDNWKPEAGYEWVNGTTAETAFRYGVVWVPGKSHPSVAHVIAAQNENDWVPAPGYQWKDYWTWFLADEKPTISQKLRCGVKWSPGIAHPDHRHVVAATKEGEWTPAEGWKWLTSISNDFRVVECNIVEKGVTGIRNFLDDLFS